MALWVVRAGRHGERETFAIENGQVVIGWDDLPNLGGLDTREAVEQLVRTTYPAFQPAKIANHTGQIWAFLRRIELNDLVVLPLKSRSAIAVGVVQGPYRYVADAPEFAHHSRPVRWLRTDIPRSDFDTDLLYSFGGLLTVFQVSRNDAEARVQRMLEGKKATTASVDDAQEVAAEQALNIEEYATDQIRDYISRKYRGHELAYLIGDILRAQGYQVYVSPPGPDAGVDILAGSGPMGFDAPRIAVQVKSSDSPVDVSVLRELQGVMPRFGADQGLIVAWGGFKESVLREARQLFFRIKLWDSGNVITALNDHYQQLPKARQAELPLKQVWALALEE